MRSWRCGRFTLDLDAPRVMGIINLTPDSFSDGGIYASPNAAIAAAERLIAEGADVIDLGAESTRPGAAPLPATDELERLMPVLHALRDAPIPLSVDTYKPLVMQAALDAGASIINDVWGARQPGALDVLRSVDCGVVLMHMQGVPQTMQLAPTYQQVGVEVEAFLKQQLALLTDAGVNKQRILVDPGFGFGKRLEDNVSLMHQLGRFAELGAGLLVGLSRKGMLGSIVNRPAPERVGASIGAAIYAVARGARVIRCHDVAATLDALKVWSFFTEAPALR